MNRTVRKAGWFSGKRPHPLLFALLLVLIVSGCGDEGASAPISAEALLGRLDDGTAPVILDVRSTGEYSTIHIAGSLNIPHYTLEDRLGELPGPDSEIVLVDQKGGRARAARQTLSDAGFTNIRILDGHMFQWVMNQYPTE